MSIKIKALIFGLLLACLFSPYQYVRIKNVLHTYECSYTKIYQSPEGHAADALVQLIEQANIYVYFAIYTLTDENITNALIAAKLRGLDVQGVVDLSQTTLAQEKPMLRKLEKFNILLVKPLKEQGLMHMKLLITDQAYAMGSFNWTNSAEHLNDEVLEIGTTKAIHDQYVIIFKNLYKKYTSR